MKYAQQGADEHAPTPILFEVQMGMIDRAADLSWISQYPFEMEGSQAKPHPPRATPRRPQAAPTLNLTHTILLLLFHRGAS